MPPIWFHFTIRNSTLLYYGSTSFCLTVIWLNFTPPYCKLLYYGSTSLYLTLHYSTMALLHSTSRTLQYSTVALRHSTWHYVTLQWLYFTPLDSTTLPWLYFTLLDSTLLYHGSTSLWLSRHYSTLAILHSNSLYNSLLWLYFITLYWF